VLPDSFVRLATRVATYPYVKEGTDLFLADLRTAAISFRVRVRELIVQPLRRAIIGTEKAETRIW